MASIVMVHGAFCASWSFDRLRGPFEALGYQVLAPDLRGHADGDTPDRVIGVSMSDYADEVAALVRGLAEPPILLGHSMGGLVAQMAAARCEVRALVLLAPTPPWGVAGSSIEEAITAFGVGMLGPFSSGAVEPDAGLMRHYSLNRMPPAEREAIIARLKPESARALREALNWWLDPFMTTSLGPGRLKAPALALAGELDVVHPPQTVRQTAERIGAAFQSMPQMSHWLPGEPGWEDVSAAILRWLTAEGRAAA